jgi:hypothetical protein
VSANARFFTEAPDDAHLEALRRLAPTSPFVTSQFFRARVRTGWQARVLGLRDAAGTMLSGCGAFMRGRRLNRLLEIPSLPPVGLDSPFWIGLRDLVRDERVTALQLDSFASEPKVEIPSFGGACATRDRLEFILDLTEDPGSLLRSNHKRNARKAAKAGMEIRRTRSTEHVSDHQALRSWSMDRRRSRGERIREVNASSSIRALVGAGAGTLFQARLRDETLSSVLVLHSPRSGYYHSAGTSREGMSIGASHWLLLQIAMALRDEGAATFNLGGAPEDSGLARFKTGFGASPRSLAAASCDVGPAWRRVVTALVSAVRR